MSALSIQPTFPIFTETDGLPLENGYIWIGTANLDPQGNPINVYWDAALTILAPQPIRTINGYPSRNGTPGRLYVNSDYSIRVQNSKGSMVYSAPAATERYNEVVISGVNAQDVIYDPPFTGAVQTNVEAKLAQNLSVKDFGAVGNGIIDDTIAFKTAINAAKGGYVFVPIGEYRITSPLDSGVTEEIRLIGPSSAFFSHGFINFATYNYSNNFSPACIADPAGLKTKFATIKCDGTNLLGSADGVSVGTKDTLRHMANLCVYGYNGAQIGLYMAPGDALVENCNFALFEKFGICIRGGITSTFRKISFVDNGWNLNESGSTVYPATYVSGCAFNVVSNFIPNDFATAVGGNATTTMSFENFYINVRGWTVQNQSGYRGIQVHLARGLNLDDIGSYTGHYFYIATGSANNIYVENYSFHGLTASSSDPYCIYSKYSAMDLNNPVVANVSVTNPAIFVDNEAQPWSPNAINYNSGKSSKTEAGSVTSRWDGDIQVVTPGGTNTYTLYNNTIPSTVGFCGFLIVSIYKNADLADYANACYFVQKHNAGAGGVQIAPETLISSYIGIAPYQKTISAATFNSNGAIKFDVTWSATYGAGESFHVNFALVGMDTITAP